jgi:hypothetical protein
MRSALAFTKTTSCMRPVDMLSCSRLQSAAGGSPAWDGGRLRAIPLQAATRPMPPRVNIAINFLPNIYLKVYTYTYQFSSQKCRAAETSSSLHSNSSRYSKKWYSKSVLSGNLIRLLSAYAPSTQKIYFKMSKKLTKSFAFKYSQSKRVYKFRRKALHYVVYVKRHVVCKKIKIIMWNVLFLAPNFMFFYTRHMTRRFVVQRLCGHVTREDVSANFLFQFFDILQCEFVS